MESKKTTNPIQTQLLLEWGVPAETADMFRNPGTSSPVFVHDNVDYSDDVKRYLSWTVDALIDYLCDDCEVCVQFSRATWGGFWICCYTRNDGETKVTVSKAGPSKIDALFEVIYELKRGKYGTGTEKEN